MAKFFDFSHLRGDIFGGLTAGVVALPLALAFGEASVRDPLLASTARLLSDFLPHSLAARPHRSRGQPGR